MKCYELFEPLPARLPCDEKIHSTLRHKSAFITQTSCKKKIEDRTCFIQMFGMIVTVVTLQ